MYQVTSKIEQLKTAEAAVFQPKLVMNLEQGRQEELGKQEVEELDDRFLDALNGLGLSSPAPPVPRSTESLSPSPPAYLPPSKDASGLETILQEVISRPSIESTCLSPLPLTKTPLDQNHTKTPLDSNHTKTTLEPNSTKTPMASISSPGACTRQDSTSLFPKLSLESTGLCELGQLGSPSEVEWDVLEDNCIWLEDGSRRYLQLQLHRHLHPNLYLHSRSAPALSICTYTLTCTCLVSNSSPRWSIAPHLEGSRNDLVSKLAQLGRR